MTSVQILQCPRCSSYALTEQCSCGSVRLSPKPPKYSPDDRYASYRRQYKELHPAEARRQELIPEFVKARRHEE